MSGWVRTVRSVCRLKKSDKKICASPKRDGFYENDNAEQNKDNGICTLLLGTTAISFESARL